MTDRYTKAVLTVIAVCLVWMVARDVQVVGTAQAYGDTQVEVTNWPSSQRVNVGNWPATQSVKVEKVGQYAFTYAGSMPVEVQNWPRH